MSDSMLVFKQVAYPLKSEFQNDRAEMGTLNWGQKLSVSKLPSEEKVVRINSTANKNNWQQVSFILPVSLWHARLF